METIVKEKGLRTAMQSRTREKPNDSLFAGSSLTGIF